MLCSCTLWTPEGLSLHNYFLYLYLNAYVLRERERLHCSVQNCWNQIHFANCGKYIYIYVCVCLVLGPSFKCFIYFFNLLQQLQMRCYGFSKK